MKRRLLSLLLCLTMLLGLLPVLTPPVKAATANENNKNNNQNNIVARADYLYNITWLCQKTVSGWCGNYNFYAGTAYHLPYGQPINAGAYIGYDVSVDSFISATKSASNVFYTSRSTYGTTNSVYYATDCSAFVSWCWGIDRKTTYSIPLTSGVTYIGMATAANTSKLQLGDCLNSNDVGHVVLVTDLVYNSSGALTQIEITEQTPPQMKRSYYTPSELGSYYGGYYGIYRYTGTVPEAPVGITSKYYPSCDSSYTSLYPALESIGVYCDWTLHCQIAALNGITNFSGTVAQNTQLLDLLKAGKLLNPSYSGTDREEPDTGGSFLNGYKNGYTGGMAGDGKIYAHGLDVSQWQGTSLDFNSIKKAGYDYVILRAGTSYGKDTCFESYYTKARAAGLDIGTYYYTYATSVSAAQTDADNMLSWIAGKTFEYPVYFDYEDPSQDSLSTTTAKNICLTFCDAMAEAGYLAGVYTGYYKSTQLPMSEICAKYEVWIANYWDYGYETLSPSYSTKYGMYQYTDRNYIGSNGPYDGDVAFKDYPTIVKQYGFNGYGNPNVYLDKCTFYPTYCKVTTTKSTPLNTLPCSTSTSYGSRTLVTAEPEQTYVASGLYLNTSGNYWYQITLETGEIAYLYGGHGSFVEALSTDISITGASLPTDMLEGEGFTVTGKVTSTQNQLDQVDVGIYTGSGMLGTLVVGSTATAGGNSCDLSGVSLDFTTLEPGSYSYNITAKYSGYYATSSTEITTYSAQMSLKSANFNVESDMSYAEECTVYPAYCQVTTSQITDVNNLPCSAGANGSESLMTAGANTTFTANALYRNTDGYLWYQVSLDSAETAYLFAGHTTYVQDLTTDIYLVDWAVPGNMTVGGSFDVVGTLGASYNRLLQANVTVYSGNAAGTPITGGSAEVSDNTYTLNGSAVAAATNFVSLAAGTYMYEVSGSYTNYYAIGEKTLATNVGTKILWQSTFTVTECAHSFTTSVTKNPTCTEAGILERICSKCGQVNRSSIVTNGHSYSSVTIAPTCTEVGGIIYTCSVCGDSYAENVVAALGHRYTTAYTAPTCTTAGRMKYTCTACADCYEEPVSATGHSYTHQVIPPTCEGNGNTIHTCTVCGYAYNDSLTAPTGHNYSVETVGATCTEAGGNKYTCLTCGDSFIDGRIPAIGHNYRIETVGATCTEAGGNKYTCLTCGDSFIDGSVAAAGHRYVQSVIDPTCTVDGYTTHICVACGDRYTDSVVAATGHSYSGGSCTVCGIPDSNYNPNITQPTLTLKAPTLEFKDVITVNAFYTAENTQDVVEMGMITYSTKVPTWSVATAEHVVPGATYDESTGRYVSASQGIHAKYLGDTVYLAIYAKLSDGSYAYSKLASYSPVQYAISQLKNSTDTALKQLVVAMLNYGAEAQLYFGHNTAALANATLTADQKALPAAYDAGMIKAVPSPSVMKQGVFLNNSGFASRKPAISFEGAFCINYFFTPNYTPENGITLYYWNASAYNRAGVLTTANATGKLKLEGSGTGEYRGDITGISAKALSEAVYVACAYKSGGTVWTSGVLGYSIGAYCAGQASKANAISNLAMATAVYGYHAKQYFV